MDIKKEGFLVQQQEILFFERWKRMWFTLQGRTLAIYKDDKSIGKPVDTVDLDRYRVYKFKNKQFCNRPNTFALVPQVGLKYMVFQADNEVLLEEWFQALRLSIGPTETSKPISIEKRPRSATTLLPEDDNDDSRSTLLIRSL